MSPARLRRRGLSVAAAVLVLDQVSKWWILEVVMQPPRTIPLAPFFNLVLGWNRGVSFGMFNSQSPLNAWILPILALAITVVLTLWLFRTDQRWISLALGLVIGGALGNLVDRLRFGAVADFLDLHLAGYHWPAFNVADTGITLGAAVLVLDALFGGPEKHKKGKEERTDNKE